jgi:hypothetical protein
MCPPLKSTRSSSRAHRVDARVRVTSLPLRLAPSARSTFVPIDAPCGVCAAYACCRVPRVYMASHHADRGLVASDEREHD